MPTDTKPPSHKADCVCRYCAAPTPATVDDDDFDWSTHVVGAPKKRALRVLIDRCKGCLCCHPGHVPGTRLCKHPALAKPTLVLDEEYEAETVPAWCPAAGVVLMAAGPRPSDELVLFGDPPAVLDAMDAIARRRAAEEDPRLLDEGGAGVRRLAGPDDTTTPFHVCVGGVAACDRSLVLKNVVPASAVAHARRCRRGPCRVAWPSVLDEEGARHG